jgi:hypothetical protein
LFLSKARLIQSTLSQPTSPRSILILSTYLCLGLPSGLFPSGFPTNNLYAFSPPPIRATYHFHLILLYLNILILLGEEYKSRSSSSCSFLHPPVTSSPLKSHSEQKLSKQRHETLYINCVSIKNSVNCYCLYYTQFKYTSYM